MKINQNNLNLQKGNKLSWHFIAPNVHDFTWAADPNYTHDILKTKSGTELHFLYKNDKKYQTSVERNSTLYRKSS